MKEIFSLYKNYFTQEGDDGRISLKGLIERVASAKDPVAKSIAAARRALADGHKDKYNAIKSKLPCVTAWGIFTQRKASGLAEKSGVFVIDVDGHDQAESRTWDDWQELSAKLYDTDKVAACFVSPSGDGLKIFVRVIDAATPLGIVREVGTWMVEKYGLKIDTSGTDPSRLCFLSHDENAWYRMESDVWNGIEPTPDKTVYKLDRSKSVWASREATPEEAREDEKGRLLRYLDAMKAHAPELGYGDWQQAITACVGWLGVAEGVAEMVKRWPDKKPDETYKKALQVGACSNAHGCLWTVLEHVGAAGNVREENSRRKIAELKADGKAKKSAHKKAAKAEEAAEDAAEETFEQSESRIKKEKENFEAMVAKVERLNRMALEDANAAPWDGLTGEERVAQERATRNKTKDIFYDGPNRYVYDTGEKYIIKCQSDIKEALKLRGFRAKPEQGETLSEVNYALQYIQNHRNLDYSGALAGKKKGFYTINTRNLLATSSPELIEPEEGECPLLDEIIDGLLGVDDPEEAEKQKRFLFGWLQCAYSSLSKGWWRPGQALVLAGEANSGKSLLKSIIVKLLGNRTADPFPYMKGDTRFNANLAAAECLCIDDATGTTDVKTRKHVAAKIKSMLFSRSISVESKGRDPFQFEPFWRLIFCVNDDPESLLVLPVMSTDMTDKIALLQCKKWVCSIPNNTDEERHAFDERIQAELPAFLHKIMNFKIQDNEKEDRCGVRYYHNKELLEAMNAVSPEDEFVGLIDEIGKTNLGIYNETHSPKEWERVIAENGSVSQVRELQRLCGWGRASNIIMSRLFKERVGFCTRVRRRDGYYYKFYSPDEREKLRQEKVIEEYKSSGHWFEVGEQVVLASDTHDWGTEVTNARNGDVGVIVGRNDDTNSYQVRNLEWSKTQNAEGDFPTGVITCGGGLLRRLPAETGD
jgi:phage/plasmid-associated DNA primase